MALPSYARNAKTPAEHHEVYLDLIGSSQGRGIPSSMMSAMKAHAQLVKALPAKDHSMLHKKISAHVNQLVRDDEISDDEASTVKAMYAPSTTKQAIKFEETAQIDELSVIKKLNYIDAAEKNSDKLKAKMAFHYNRFNKEKGDELHNKLLSRDAGISRAYKSIEKKTGISPLKMGKLNKLRFAITREGIETSNVKEDTQMELDEKKMSDTQMAKREKIVKSMKKDFAGFKKSYEDRAEEIMNKTATKMAMKSEEVDQVEEEFKDIPYLYLQHHPLQNGKPQLPAKINKTHIHLQHIDGKVNSETAKYKVIANGARSVGYGMKVGQKVPGSTVNGMIDDARSLPDHKVVIHTAKPQRYYMGEGAEEEQPPPGQHFCAKHVLSNVFGEGVVLDGQHAEPDENGHVEWYTVQFEHGEEVIFAEDVEIMMAEFHNNHSPSKKKMKKKE